MKAKLTLCCYNNNYPLTLYPLPQGERIKMKGVVAAERKLC